MNYTITCLKNNQFLLLSSQSLFEIDTERLLFISILPLALLRMMSISKPIMWFLAANVQKIPLVKKQPANFLGKTGGWNQTHPLKV